MASSAEAQGKEGDEDQDPKTTSSITNTCGNAKSCAQGKEGDGGGEKRRREERKVSK